MSEDLTLYRLCELTGCVEEYLAMPCDSLMDRMAACVKRQKAIGFGWKGGKFVGPEQENVK